MKRFEKLFAEQSGFSLIELMIGNAIGLFLLIGLVALLVTNSQSSKELEKTGRQIENGRYAMQLLTEDINHAGYLGPYVPKGVTHTRPDACATNATNLGFATTPSVTVPVAIDGYSNPSTVPLSCLTNWLSGSDVLVIRRASTSTVLTPSANSIYLQISTCSSVATPFALAKASDTSLSLFPMLKKDCSTPEVLRQYLVRTYYLSSCNNCSGSGDGIPTLKMAELSANSSAALINIVPLAEGVESMNIEYGIDINADGAPDCYLRNPSNPDSAEITSTLCPTTGTSYVWTDPITNWSNVTTVRINLLVRNNEISGDWTDTKTYHLGLAGTVGPFNDRYKRQAYSAVARVLNLSAQRESP